MAAHRRSFLSWSVKQWYHERVPAEFVIGCEFSAFFASRTTEASDGGSGDCALGTQNCNFLFPSISIVPLILTFDHSRMIVLRQSPGNSPRRDSIMGLGRMHLCPAGILRRLSLPTDPLHSPGRMERSMSRPWSRTNCHWALGEWLLRTTASTTNTVNHLSHRNRMAFLIIPFLPRCDPLLWFRVEHRTAVTHKQIILPTIPTVHHATLIWIMDMDTVHPPTPRYILVLLA